MSKYDFNEKVTLINLCTTLSRLTLLYSEIIALCHFKYICILNY